MKLSEALRASKTRRALGFIDIGARFGSKLVEHNMPVPVADADDGSVEFIYPTIAEDGSTKVNTHERCAWADLLPHYQSFLFSLRWEPQDPKDPLTQLAETLTDWQEDD